MTTPAQRARALLAKFGPVTELHRNDKDGYWLGRASVAGVDVDVASVGHHTDHLAVYVYDWSSDNPTLLSLHGVRDDDLVEQIVRQVIDHHNGWQVI